MRSMRGGLVQRRQRGDEHHRRAVGTRRDPARQVREVLGVHLGDHERDVGLHAERGRVVDDACAAAAATGAHSSASGSSTSTMTRSRPSKQPSRSTSHVTSPPANGRRAALGPRGRVGPEGADGEGPLLEDAEHLLADEAGGSDDADINAHDCDSWLGDVRAGYRPYRSTTSRRFRSSNAACRARTARSTSAAGTTQEIRIELTWRSSRCSRPRSRAPRTSWRRRRDSSACPRRRGSRARRRSRGSRRWPRCRPRPSPSRRARGGGRPSGTVNEMSVWPAVDTFCTIMSTFTASSASARNSDAATPGRSATCAIVTLASEVSCVTPEMMAYSMFSSSSTTQVPGSHVNDDRTCTGTPWLRANSTERSASTLPPVAAISSISSNDTARDLPRVGHDARIGGEHAGDVGVDLAHLGAERGGERDRGGVRAAPPEGGDVLRGADALEPGDDGHRTRRRASRGCGRP